METDDDADFKDAEGLPMEVSTLLEISQPVEIPLPPEECLQLANTISDAGSAETSIPPELSLQPQELDDFSLLGTSSIDSTYNPVPQSSPSDCQAQAERKGEKLTESASAESSSVSGQQSLGPKAMTKPLPPPKSSKVMKKPLPPPKSQGLSTWSSVGTDIGNCSQDEENRGFSKSLDHGLDVIDTDSSKKFHAARKLFEQSTSSPQAAGSKHTVNQGSLFSRQEQQTASGPSLQQKKPSLQQRLLQQSEPPTTTPQQTEPPAIIPQQSEPSSMTPLQSGKPSITQLQFETPPVTPQQLGTPTTMPLQSGTPTMTPLQSGKPSITQLQFETPPMTPQQSGTPTTMPLQSGTSTITPLQSETPTITPLQSETPTVTPLQSETPTVTPLQSKTPTITPLQSKTPITIPLQSETPTVTPLQPETPTIIPLQSETPTMTPQQLGTSTMMPMQSGTPTVIPLQPGTPAIISLQSETSTLTPQQPGIPIMTPQQSGTPTLTPQQPGTPITMPQQPGTPITIPQQPGTPIMMPQQPGTPIMMPQQPGTPIMMPQQPGTPIMMPQQPGTPIMMPQQPGTPIMMPQQSGTPIMMPQQPGTPIMKPQQSGTPIMTPQQLGTPAVMPQQPRMPTMTPLQSGTRPGVRGVQLDSSQSGTASHQTNWQVPMQQAKQPYMPPQARQKMPHQARQQMPPHARQQMLPHARQQMPPLPRQQMPPHARQQMPSPARQQTPLHHVRQQKPPQARQHHEIHSPPGASARPTDAGADTDKSATAPCTVRVANKEGIIDEDLLRMYFDNPKKGGTIEKLDCHPDEGYALITFEDPEVVSRILNQRHSLDRNKTWLDITIHHEPSPPQSPEPDTDKSATAPCTVRVANKEGIIDEDLLRMYFDNPKKGGTIKKLDCHPDERYALITFEDPEVVSRILNQRHSLDRNKTWLDITIHHEPSPPQAPGPDSFCTVEVSGDDVVLDEEMMRLYFTSHKMSSGGEVTDIQKLEDRGVILITFKDHAVAKAVVEKTDHLLGKARLVVVPYKAPSSSSTRLKVSGLADNVNDLLLKLYFQNIIDDDVEIDHFDAKNGEAVVTLPCQKAVDLVLAREHMLKERRFNVSMFKNTPKIPTSEANTQDFAATVSVKGVPLTDCYQEKLSNYFENKRSGGRNVKDVQLDPTKKSFLVTFENPEVAANVVSRQHCISNHTLTVEPYKPPERYKDRISLRNLPDLHTAENLQNYLESKLHLAVDEIFFGDDEGVGVVIFERDINDPDALQEALTEDALFQNLIVEAIPVSSTVLVRDLPDVKIQTLEFHFQNTLRSGGEGVTGIDLKSDAHCALVTFKDAKVASRVAEKKHTIKGHPVMVSMYLECLGLGGGSREPTLTVPPPLPVVAENLCKISFLDQLPTHKDTLLALLDQGHASLDMTASGAASIACTLTDAVAGCRRLARTWQSDTQRILQAFLDDIFSEQLEVTEEEFTEIQDVIEKKVTGKSDIGFFQKVESRQLVVVYKGTEQKGSVDHLLADVRTVLERFQRKKKEVTETMDYTQGQQILLREQSVIQEIAETYPDFQITYLEKEGRVQLKGLHEEISTVKSIFQKTSSGITSLSHQWKTDLQGKLFTKSAAVKVVQSCCLQQDPNSVVEVTTKSLQVYSFEKEKAEQALVTGMRNVQQRVIHYSDADKEATSSEEWTQLKKSVLNQNKDETLMEEDSSSLTIVSVSSAIETNFNTLKNFLSENRILESTSLLPECLHKLYRHYVDAELNKLQISGKGAFRFDASRGLVVIKGKSEFIDIAKQIYFGFREKLVGKRKTYTWPFLNEFFTTHDWLRKKEDMFNIQKCVVVNPGDLTDDFLPVKDTSADSAAGSQMQFSLGHKRTSLHPAPAPMPKVPETAKKSQGSFVTPYFEFPGSVSSKPKIIVKASDITKEKVDVVVNSVNNTLELNRGKVSSAVIKAGGSSITDECKANYPNGVQDGEMAITGGGNLPCKKIFHYALPAEKNYAKGVKVVQEAVQKCLAMADKFEMTSVAFPALGTGNFGYPVAMVVRAMSGAVHEYGQQNVSTRISEVIFILAKSFLKDIPKKPKVTTKKTDITKVRLGVVVNSVATSLELDKGQVSKALVAAGGPTIQDECKANHPNGIKAGEIAITGGGNLPCKKIFHYALPSESDTAKMPKVVQDAVWTCLKEADKLGMTSIGFPSFGTGNFGFPAALVAQAMFDAALDYGWKNAVTFISEVTFILYEKDKVVVKAFEDQEHLVNVIRYLHNKTVTTVTKPVTQTTPSPTQPAVCHFPFFEQSMESAQKVIMGLSQANVTETERQMIDCYKDNVKTLSVDVNELQHWQDEDRQIITYHCQKKEVSVTFNCDLKKLEFCGFYYNLTELNEKIRDVETNVHRNLQAKFLKEQVQWKYIEVTYKGERLLDYSALNNLEIEEAYLANKPSVMVNKDGFPYFINLDKMEEVPEHRQGDLPLMVVRKDMLQGIEVPLPDSWTDMKDQNVDSVPLSPSSDEYINVAAKLMDSLKMPSAKIKMIHRIQNLILFKQYHALKHHIEASISLEVERAHCERDLWHGTYEDSATRIIEHGFMRIYLQPRKNTDDTPDAEKKMVPYGQGAYFTASAKYCCSKGYAKASGRTKERNIFFCKVLVGKYKVGDFKTRMPPADDSGHVYHSTVDNETSPNVFVTYHDAQAYPLYRIVFTDN